MSIGHIPSTTRTCKLLIAETLFQLRSKCRTSYLKITSIVYNETMSSTDNHPLVLLVIATCLVTAISGGVFGMWAKYDVLPSTLDNTYSQTSCSVLTSEITSTDERCSCHEDGLSCSYKYPCIVIKVITNTSMKMLQLYKDLTSYTFSKKVSINQSKNNTLLNQNMFLVRAKVLMCVNFE